MAEKFDLIAKVEDGQNPITLGLAVASEEEAERLGAAANAAEASKATDNYSAEALSIASFSRNPAATAAAAAVSKETSAWQYVERGKVDWNTRVYLKSMDLGMDASHHVHDISAGGIETLSSEELQSIPVLKPPKKSFCPKCGSDIHSHTMLQWRKWRDHSGEVVQLQVQAAMEASGTQISGHHLDAIEELETKIQDMQAMIDTANPDKVRADIAAVLREELKEELTPIIEQDMRQRVEDEVRAEMVSARGISSRSGGISRSTGFGQPFRPKEVPQAAAAPTPEPEPTPEPVPEPKPEPKPTPELTATSDDDSGSESEEQAEDEATKAELPPEPQPVPEPVVEEKPKKKAAAQMLFGGGAASKKSFDGKAADKPQWFLDEALETIYDPHGSGKVLKPRTILARSAEGNVRVQDVVSIYAEHGTDGLSELAWTSPITQYIIEAYDAC